MCHNPEIFLLSCEKYFFCFLINFQVQSKLTKTSIKKNELNKCADVNAVKKCTIKLPAHVFTGYSVTNWLLLSAKDAVKSLLLF